MTHRYQSKFGSGSVAEITLDAERRCSSFHPIRPGPRTLIVLQDPYSRRPTPLVRPLRVHFRDCYLMIQEYEGRFLSLALMNVDLGGERLSDHSRMRTVATPNGRSFICLGPEAHAKIMIGELSPIDAFWNTAWYGPGDVWTMEREDPKPCPGNGRRYRYLDDQGELAHFGKWMSPRQTAAYYLEGPTDLLSLTPPSVGLLTQFRLS